MVEIKKPASTSGGGTNWKELGSKLVSLVVIVGMSASIMGIGGSMFSASYYRHEIIVLHLLAFGSWFGCSVWVSFVAGVVTFHTLPRHVFGRLQSKLFPAYFVFSAIAVAIAIGSAALLGRETRSLWVVLATVAANLLYLEPETTRVMFLRHAVERRLGTGQEIGLLAPKDPAKANDPELKALSKKFGILHGISTSLNMVALGFGCYWIHLLALWMGE